MHHLAVNKFSLEIKLSALYEQMYFQYSKSNRKKKNEISK